MIDIIKKEYELISIENDKEIKLKKLIQIRKKLIDLILDPTISEEEIIELKSMLKTILFSSN